MTDTPTKTALRPVILCTDPHTALWPASRAGHPVQFRPGDAGTDSPLRAAIARLAHATGGRPVLVVSEANRFLAGEALARSGVAGDILVEPAPRGTAASLAAAAAFVSAGAPHATLLVAPSAMAEAGLEALGANLAAAAAAGGVVLFAHDADAGDAAGAGALRVVAGGAPGGVRPCLGVGQAAQSATGDHLIAAGAFMAPAQAILDACAARAPQVLAAARAAVGEGARELDFLRLGAGFAQAPDLDFTDAVLDCNAAGVLSLGPTVGDFDTWRGVWRQADRDDAGVAMSGDVLARDCGNALLRTEGAGMTLVALGVHDIVAVAMRDAVLVASLDRAGEVDGAVAALRARGSAQADAFARCYRPWGWYETLALGPRFQVKEIMVKPGGVLSLQSHHHRCEHWTVVAGTARVTVGNEVRLLGENENVYIPLGAVHRMENPGKLDMHLIEVQTGAYLGEDDIVRYEDIYARA